MLMLTPPKYKTMTNYKTCKQLKRFMVIKFGGNQTLHFTKTTLRIQGLNTIHV